IPQLGQSKADIYSVETAFIGSGARVDFAESSSVEAETVFNASNYWVDRLQKLTALEATGTRPFGLCYQRYLYRLKEAAIERVLRPWRTRLRGARALNVGCGWGYFEPLLADFGAGKIT